MVNPRRWNLYAFVLNNPVVLSDPTGRQDRGSGAGQIIDVFLIETTPNTRNAVPLPGPDWKSIEGETNGYIVRLHDADHSSFNDVKASFEAGHSSVFVLHGVGDTRTTPFVAIGIQLGDKSQMFNDHTTLVKTRAEGVPGQPIVSTTVATTPINTGPLVALFGCNTINAVAATNPASLSTVLVGVTGGGDGESATGTSNAAAFAFVKSYVTSGGQVDPAINAAQSVFGSSAVPMDRGDRVEQGSAITIPPPPPEPR